MRIFKVWSSDYDDIRYPSCLWDIIETNLEFSKNSEEYYNFEENEPIELSGHFTGEEYIYKK